MSYLIRDILQVMADTDVEEARTILPAAGYMDTGDMPDSIDWREQSRFFIESLKITNFNQV